MTRKQWKNPPEMLIDPDNSYQAKMETSRGQIELELYPQHAPKTKNGDLQRTDRIRALPPTCA